MTPDPEMDFRSWQHLGRLAARSQVVCVQETHSDDATMNDAAARLSPTHFASHSACAQADTGGVMTSVSNELADATSMRHEVLLQGRLTVTCVRTQGQRIHRANVHNHDVPAMAVRALREYMRRATTSSPPEYVFLAGDWNFPSDTGGASTKTTERGDTTSGRATYQRRTWRTALGATTELGHELPTRAAEFTMCEGTKAITMSSPDRLYTTIPPPVLAEVATTVEFGQIRDALQAQRRVPLSDPVYVRTTLRLRPSMHPHVRPIPQWVTRHPIYAREVRRRLEGVHVESLHPHDALRRSKQAIRGAAATTRNKCLRRRPTAPHEYTQLGLQVARALARHDMTMVCKIARTWPAVRATITSTDGVATITDLPALTKLIGMAIADPTLLTTRAGDTTKASARRSNTQDHDARGPQRRWMRLLVPHRQRQWSSRPTNTTLRRLRQTWTPATSARDFKVIGPTNSSRETSTNASASRWRGPTSTPRTPPSGQRRRLRPSTRPYAAHATLPRDRMGPLTPGGETPEPELTRCSHACSRA